MVFFVSCDPANLEPISGQRICDDVGYALSSRAYQCGLSTTSANQLFTQFEKEFSCDASSVENELSFVGLTNVYACVDSLRNTPCDSVKQWGDSLSIWFAQSSDCQILTQSSANLPDVRIDSLPCASGGRSLQLPASKGVQLNHASRFANEGNAFAIRTWIKGDHLPGRSGILGAEMEVAGKMTAYLEDERSAVQRIRLATGDFGGCTDGFPDQRLVLEIGNRNREGGNTGGLFESEVWWTDAVIMDGNWHQWLWSKQGSMVQFWVDGVSIPLQYKGCNPWSAHVWSLDSLDAWTTPVYVGAVSDRGQMVRPSALAFDELSLWNKSLLPADTVVDSLQIVFLSFDSLETDVVLPKGSHLEADCAE